MGVCDVLYRWPIQAWRDLQALGQKQFGDFGIVSCVFVDSVMTEKIKRQDETMVQNNTIGLKPGWHLKFLGASVVLLVHRECRAYIIDLTTTEHGDMLPRDIDKPIEWDLVGTEE